MRRTVFALACVLSALGSAVAFSSAAQPVSAASPSSPVIGHGELVPGARYERAPGAQVEDAGDDYVPPPGPLPPPQLPPGSPGGGKPDPYPNTPPQGGKPDPLSPRVAVFDPAVTDIKLGNDPQLAVGERFVIGIEAHNFAFFDKKTGQQLGPKPDPSGVSLPTRIDSFDFFGVFLDPTIVRNGKTEPNPDDVNRHIANNKAGGPLHCDADKPGLGCVDEAYDSRVLYDGERHRFWIAAALRNHTQVCKGATLKGWICVKDGSPLKQRLIAVAVSRSEDPRDGFCLFLTSLFQSGDWPLMAVHGPFLILASMSKTEVTLLDAGKLAKLDSKALCAKGDDDVGLGAFSGIDFGEPGHVYPVVQHDKRDATDPSAKPSIPIAGPPGATSSDVPTFLVATSGTTLSVFSFEPVRHDRPQQLNVLFHPALSSSTIDLGHGLPDIRTQPVYRNGRIYISGDECSVDVPGCVHRVRVMVLPVFRIGPDVVVSRDPKLGFEDFTLSAADHIPALIAERVAGTSFEMPAIEVNKDGDFVVAYDRAMPLAFPGFKPAMQTGVTYSVFYRAAHERRDGVLQAGTCGPGVATCQGLADPIAAGLDFSGIGVDPSDDTTVWGAHGFADGGIGGYRMVIGKIEPRGAYVAAH
jgi:hypothetical protein